MRKQVWKMGLLLCVALLMICAVTAHAVAEESVAVIASGACGSNLTWEFTNDGVLAINGRGAMSNYQSTPYSAGSNAGVPPWSQYATEIKSIVIGNRVTSIGDYAFYYGGSYYRTNYDGTLSSSLWDAYYCNLTSVTIPDSVTSIGDYAFYACKYMTGDLKLPRGLSAVGEYAFYNCSGLDGTLTLNNNLTSIGNNAFSGCEKIKGDLTIPNSVNNIGSHAFRNCVSMNGTLTLGSGLASIGQYAFYNCGFTGELVLPEGLKAIEQYTFYDCEGFTGSLIIPSNIQTIGLRAFENCYGFDGDLTLEEGVTAVYECAFNYCDGFTGSLSLADSIVTIGSSAFYNCSGFTGELVLPVSLTKIGADVFNGCYGFSGTPVLGEKIVEIGNRAFYYCDGFEGVIDIPDSVAVIGANAFSACSGVTGFKFRGNAPEVKVASETTASFNPSITIFADINTTGWGESGRWQGYRLEMWCSHTNIQTQYKSLGGGFHTVVTYCDCGETLSSEDVMCEDKRSDNICDQCAADMQAGQGNGTFTVVGTTINLGNELMVNFYLPKAKMDAIEQELTVYLIHRAAEEDIKYTFDKEDWVINKDNYVFSVPVKSTQMADDIEIAVKDADGKQYNETYIDSIRAYVSRMAKPTSSTYNRTLMVDMVNYGAASQNYFTYKTDDLANSMLTDDQKAWATASVECTNDDQVMGTNYVGSTLNLKDRILLNVYFKNVGVTEEILETMYATVSFTGYKNNVVNEDVPVLMNKNGLYVEVKQIVLGDSFEPVTVTIYNEDGSIYGQGSDSVESYASRNSTKELFANIAKFAYAGREYLLNK